MNRKGEWGQNVPPKFGLLEEVAGYNKKRVMVENSEELESGRSKRVRRLSDRSRNPNSRDEVQNATAETPEGRTGFTEGPGGSVTSRGQKIEIPQNQTLGSISSKTYPPSSQEKQIPKFENKSKGPIYKFIVEVRGSEKSEGGKNNIRTDGKDRDTNQ